MKKILPVLVLGSLLIALVAPMVALAQGPPECCKMRKDMTIDTESVDTGDIVGAPDGICPAEIGTIDVETEKWGLFCFLNTLHSVVDWIFVILIVVAVLFVVLGGMNIIMAGGDPEKVATGRKYVMYAFIGLIVAFIARAIPSIVKMAMGY